MIENELVKRYKKLGCNCKNIKLKDSLRINTLKITEKELVERLKKINVKLKKIPFTDTGYFYESKFSLASTTEYLQGYIYIQEAASQLPAQILNPEEKDIILDMAASPGSKTTHLAAIMNNKGTIIAIDNDSRRLLSLRNNLERCGVKNTILYKKDARFITDFGIEFDKILLDAPCSGNYVIEENFLKTKNIYGILERARIQKELLKAAVNVLKKHGILVYSTCSLEPEENEMNIDWLIKKYPEMKIEEITINIGDPGLTNIFGKKLNTEIRKTKRFWPEKTGTEGFYIAKLRKTK
ncbi:MAG: RsmB/NOP family class I SAM-dependent RNA methyltransferase [Candidatus Woesearchaeota archaeon]